MFYRGFDGPLLRERFLEGNDTHEIKLILAVSRNANAPRAKFYCGRKGLRSLDWVQTEEEGVYPQRVDVHRWGLEEDVPLRSS